MSDPNPNQFSPAARAQRVGRAIKQKRDAKSADPKTTNPNHPTKE